MSEDIFTTVCPECGHYFCSTHTEGADPWQGACCCDCCHRECDCCRREPLVATPDEQLMAEVKRRGLA